MREMIVCLEEANVTATADVTVWYAPRRLGVDVLASIKTCTPRLGNLRYDSFGTPQSAP